MSTTNSLLGWVDGRRRALVNLRVGPHRTVCASIDTGFNGYLLWESIPDDLADFGGLSPLYEEIDVAGGRSLVRLGMSHVQWLGDEAEIESLFALNDKQLRPGDPIALVGTALLSGTILAIDFVEGTVNIHRSG